MTINKVGGQSAQASTEASSETQVTTGSPSDSSVATFDAALQGPLPESQGSDHSGPIDLTDHNVPNVLAKDVQGFNQSVETAQDSRLTLDWGHGARSGNAGDLASFDPTFGFTSVDHTSFDHESLRQELEASRQELEANYQEYNDRLKGR